MILERNPYCFTWKYRSEHTSWIELLDLLNSLGAHQILITHSSTKASGERIRYVVYGDRIWLFSSATMKKEIFYISECPFRHLNFCSIILEFVLMSILLALCIFVYIIQGMTEVAVIENYFTCSLCETVNMLRLIKVKVLSQINLLFIFVYHFLPAKPTDK